LFFLNSPSVAICSPSVAIYSPSVAIYSPSVASLVGCFFGLLFGWLPVLSVGRLLVHSVGWFSLSLVKGVVDGSVSLSRASLSLGRVIGHQEGRFMF
jgi:hypothetical protein